MAVLSLMMKMNLFLISLFNIIDEYFKLKIIFINIKAIIYFHFVIFKFFNLNLTLL